MASIAEATVRLREIALRYPEAVEDHPWGHDAWKVRGRMFLSASKHEGVLYLTMKLPHSFEFAIEYPFASPAGYGLGKSRWVTSAFRTGADVPLDLFEAWMDESYRAIAPKKLVKALDTRG